MNGRLSDNMVSILLSQALKEKYNSSFYATLANNMSVLGYTNSANFFMSQHEEETEHYLKIWKYLMDRNSKTTMYEIDGVVVTFDNLIEAFSAALDLEYQTTEEWKKIYSEAMKEADFITLELARSFMEIQKNEEEEFMTINDELKLIGNDTSLLKIWDNNFK